METPDCGAEGRAVKFPVKLKYRGQVLARIYAKTESHPYRLYWRVARKTRIREFPTYAKAKQEGDKLVAELAKGSQVAALTPKEASAAISIRDALEAFRRDTGRRFSPVEAVNGFLDAMRHLPEGSNGLTESVKTFARTLGTVKPKAIDEGVEEFIAARKHKSEAAKGQRAQISPVYAAHVETWLREFAAMFPGHRLGDLNGEFLARYVAKHSKLSPKSRNDRRATVAMFVRWCVRHDPPYLPATQRLLGSDAMERETFDASPTDFYRPAEFRALLEAAEGPMRAIIALQGLAGLRLEEALRLTWEDVWHVAGHIEITAQKAKTRRRRLVEINPALAAWLEPFRGLEGRVWKQTATLNGFVSAFIRLREPLKILSRRNGLRHAFCSFHFALHANENLTAALAGNSPAMIHAHYKGLATKAEAEKWFAVKPSLSARGANVIQLANAASQ